MPLTASYNDLLNDLNREVAKARPSDPLQFCANFFNSKLEEQRRNLLASSSSSSHAYQPSTVGPSDIVAAPGLASPTQRGSIFNADPFSSTSSTAPMPVDTLSPESSFPPSSAGTTAAPPAGGLIPPTFNLGRRTSVSAESMAPSAVNAEHDGASPLPKTVIPKSEEQMQRIQVSIGNNLLFRNLEQDQYRDVLLAMKEVKVDSGVTVIEQGAQGDYFYVVEQGTLDVYVGGAREEGGLGDKKVSYGPGSSFGELALLYAQPRAATVLSTSPCTLWALDRVTFRSILMETNSRRRALYEKFLMDVPLFERLEPSERAKISDSLELREYSSGESVITQGERGTEFFIIVEGNAEVRKAKDGREDVVGKLSRGDYFGELALLNNAPRAATVAAVGEKLRVVTMSERAFTRLLGPLAGILERHAKETYGDYSGVVQSNNAGLAVGQDTSSFPNPMDKSATPGEGNWARGNPFATA